MKKTGIYLAMLLTGAVTLSSCNFESKSDKNDDEEKIECSDIEIKYLEDFAQFENHKQVEDFFGKENVEESEVWRAEGTILYPVTILDDGKSYSTVIYWNPDKKEHQDFQHVESAYSSYTLNGNDAEEGGNSYPTRVEMELGMTLSDMEVVNGDEFTFFGMAWDYAGSVIDLDSRFDNYSFTVGCPIMESQSEWSDEYYNIIGDSEFSSNDENALELGVELVSIIYYGE